MYSKRIQSILVHESREEFVMTKRVTKKFAIDRYRPTGNAKVDAIRGAQVVALTQLSGVQSKQKTAPKRNRK